MYLYQTDNDALIFPLLVANYRKLLCIRLNISAIHQNFRGQCPRVRAFSHVWSNSLINVNLCSVSPHNDPIESRLKFERFLSWFTAF